jgi:TolB protein
MKTFLSVALAVLVFSSAQAESRLSVVKQAGKTSIVVNPFAGDAQAAKILTDTLINDLNINGRFDVRNIGQGEAVFSGSVKVSGGTATAEGRLSLRGQNVMSQTVSGSSNSQQIRRLAHQLADDIVEKVTGEPGIASSRIAFISRKSGSKEVYVMDYDGANAFRLTSDRVICGSPSLSRDGKRVAYTSYKEGYPDVYVHDIDRKTRKRVAAFGGLNSGASFSPDGGELALTLSKDGNALHVFFGRRRVQPSHGNQRGGIRAKLVVGRFQDRLCV